MTRPATLPELRAHYGERYRWLLLMAVMVGSVAAIMSSTIVNVGVPDMSRYFSLGQERAQWVTSGFMVAMTASMLTTPWLLARYGYRRTYGGTMCLLLAGGVAGGLANNFSLVLAARVAEGLAAGVVQPIPAIVIMRAFEPQEQGRAMSVFGLGAVLAPALGPSVGGLLVDWFGWRSIFFMVVPFCLASLWLSSRLVPMGAPGGAAAGPSNRLDWISLLLASIGTLGLLNGLVQLHSGPSVEVALLIGGALAVFACFVLRQRYLSGAKTLGADKEPLMNLAVFADRRFAMGSLVALIYGMALFGSTYLLPVYMQVGLQLSASHVGTILLPASLALACSIGLVGRFANRYPTHVLVSLGLALLAASFILIRTVHLATGLWLIAVLTTIGRIGLGLIMPSLNLGAMRSLHKDLIPQGASVINFVRMLGGAVGVGLCGIVLEWRLAAHGDSLANARSSVARLDAFNEAFLMLASFCLLALLAAWQLRGPAARGETSE